MNRYTFMELDGALAERLNEILLELPKKAPYKERRAEADEALEKFWAMLEGNEALQEQLDDVLSLMRGLLSTGRSGFPRADAGHGFRAGGRRRFG